MNSSTRRRRAMSSSLSRDALVDILSRLPVKSLTRFRCVSKDWSNLTANPTLIAAHLRRSAQNPSLLVRRYHIPSGRGFGICLVENPTEISKVTTLDLEVPFLGTLHRFPKIVGSSNGLICLDISPCYGLDFVLWNISMRRFERLPFPSIISPGNMPVHMVSLGFGFDYVNNDYKLVRIVYVADSSRLINPDPLVKAEVFSWSRGSWKETDVDYGPLSICGAHNGVEVNGILHWMAIGLGEFSNRKFIVSFDMADEGFGSLPLPVAARAGNVNLMSYKGSLAFAVYPGHGAATADFQLWVMNGMDGERVNWGHLFTINHVMRNVAPVGMFWKDSEVVMKQMKAEANSLWFYDHRIGSVKRLQLGLDDYSFEAYTYVESLVSVNGRG